MGFLDKLKNTFNQITGGAGQMQVMLNSMQVERGETLSFTATLTATGDLNGRAVYAQIVGTEEVKYNVEVENTTGAVSGTTTGTNTSTTSTQERTQSNQTYEFKQVLAQGEVTLQEGQNQQYSGTFQIPNDAQPTYTGIDAKHTWELRVFLDVSMGADITGEAEFVVK